MLNNAKERENTKKNAKAVAENLKTEVHTLNIRRSVGAVYILLGQKIK